MKPLRVLNVVGARPNFMKIAPIYDEMCKHADLEPYIVHTGQHYDRKMSELFFDNLGLPKPHFYLGVGSGSHGEQTGRVMIEFESTVAEVKPDLVVVVGDVNSTIACGLVAVKLGIKVAHVEAGLRSYDRAMPEEINRVLTDQISDYLFTTERSALDNLVREGISADRIHFVGNVMIDSLSRHRSKAAQQPVLSDLGIVPGEFALVTLHRPSNVDDADAFSGILDALCEISRRIPVLFPVHPRTRNRMVEFGLDRRLNEYGDIRLAEPLGYLDFLQCMANSRFVLTDSGGIQEETTVLGIPCITARENTERPITVTEGTNVVVGRDARKLLEEAHKVLDGGGKQGRVPDLWDGGASVRIVDVLRRELLTAGGGLQ